MQALQKYALVFHIGETTTFVGELVSDSIDIVTTYARDELAGRSKGVVGLCSVAVGN